MQAKSKKTVMTGATLFLLVVTTNCASSNKMELTLAFIDRMHSCLLGARDFNISEVDKNTIRIVNKKNNTDLRIYVPYGMDELSNSKINVALRTVKKEKNRECIIETITRLAILREQVDKAIITERTHLEVNSEIGKKFIPKILGEADDEHLQSLVADKAVNSMMERRLCSMSPVHCFRAIGIGSLISARIAAEKAKVNLETSEFELETISKVILFYISKRYEDAVIVENRPGYLYIKPKTVQNRALRYYKFWEQLEIKIVTSAVGETIDFTVIVDGRYAAGLSAPKNAEDYIDFEVGFAKEIDEYASEFSSDLNRFIKRAEQYDSHMQTLIFAD